MIKDTQKDSKFVVFTLGNTRYALPAIQVREIVNLGALAPLPEAPSCIKGVMSVRERLLPVVDLKECLGLGPTNGDFKPRVLIARLPKALIGLLVDRVDEIVSVSLDSVEPPPALDIYDSKRFLYGVMRVDERLVLFLNLEGVFSGGVAV